MTDHRAELSRRISTVCQKDESTIPHIFLAMIQVFTLDDFDQSEDTTMCSLFQSPSQLCSVSTSDKVSPLPHTSSRPYSPRTPSKGTHSNECGLSLQPIEQSSELFYDSGTRRTFLYTFLPFHSRVIIVTLCTLQQ